MSPWKVRKNQIFNQFFSLIFFCINDWADPWKVQGACGRIEDMEFLELLKKDHVENPGVNEKRNEISRGDWAKIMWSFHGLGFWRWKFQVISITLLTFPGVKLCFLQKFLQVRWQTSKFQRFSSKKYVFNSTPHPATAWIFSGIASFLSVCKV